MKRFFIFQESFIMKGHTSLGTEAVNQIGFEILQMFFLS